MIAIDSCVVIPWLEGVDHAETDELQKLLHRGEAALTPVTVTELLSDIRGASAVEAILVEFRILELRHGYWERAGRLRAAVRRLGRKAAMADALIAQACIDADVPLLTRDSDFRIFADVGGLKLA